MRTASSLHQPFPPLDILKIHRIDVVGKPVEGHIVQRKGLRELDSTDVVSNTWSHAIVLDFFGCPSNKERQVTRTCVKPLFGRAKLKRVMANAIAPWLHRGKSKEDYPSSIFSKNQAETEFPSSKGAPGSHKHDSSNFPNAKAEVEAKQAALEGREAQEVRAAEKPPESKGTWIGAGA